MASGQRLVDNRQTLLQVSVLGACKPTSNGTTIGGACAIAIRIGPTVQNVGAKLEIAKKLQKSNPSVASGFRE